MGRTRTAPARGAEVDRLRFAFASCQDYQAGYWRAHRHLAAEDVDLVVFLGDYIYEDAPTPAASARCTSAAPTDLAGYRAPLRRVQVRSRLQAAHAARPWVCTWDDHEVDNNYADDVARRSERGGARGEFRERRAAAYQAWYEHMPVRLEPARRPRRHRIHRSLALGRPRRFYVLDGRQYRSDQPCGTPGDVGLAARRRRRRTARCSARSRSAGSGVALADTDATWNVLAQQTMATRPTSPRRAPTAAQPRPVGRLPRRPQRLLDQLGGSGGPTR